jgi:hypothetical protein
MKTEDKIEQEKPLTAVEWLIEILWAPCQGIPSDIIEQARQMEKEKIKEELIGLLQWMNKVAENNPMAFETDSDDIVQMYLNGYYK